MRNSSVAQKRAPYLTAKFWQDNQYWHKGIMSVNGTEITWGNPLYSEATKERLDNFVAEKVKNTKALTQLKNNGTL